VAARGYGLGELKLDEILVEDLLKELIKKHKVHPGNERSLTKLKLKAEGMKRTLSLGTSATISIESLADGYDLHSTIYRLRYGLSLCKRFRPDCISHGECREESGAGPVRHW